MTESKVNRNCRVCGALLYEEPLLFYQNMPSAAQHMPDVNSLVSDIGCDLVVCQCSSCGLVQLNNDPVPYYKDVIRAVAYSPEMKTFRLRQFTDFLLNYNLVGKKVLELGCGKGEFLTLMQQAGAKAYGIEHAVDSIVACAESKLKITKGFLDDNAETLPDSPFDAFFILNFLEHLPDIPAVLRAVRANLADCGIGLIEVPNFDMILGNKLFSEFIGDHLYYFTQETLVSTLNSNGFELLECKPIWYDYILSAVVMKRPRLDISGFRAHQEKIVLEINNFISRFTDGKIAVWGAGHQALVVLSLASLSGRIRYVVDSAPFKQGKFTPASHIPIVSPDMLNSDPVEAVIVMAASYSDEVVGIIGQRYGTNLNIAVMREFGLEVL